MSRLAHDQRFLTDAALIRALRGQRAQTYQTSKAACRTVTDLCEVDIHAFVSENAAFDLVVADERIAWLDAEVRRLEECLVDVLVEAQSYRVTAREAIHALHALTVDHRKLRQKHDEVDEEYRRFREHLLLERMA